MAAYYIIAFLAMLALVFFGGKRHQWPSAKLFGFLTWIVSVLYFPIEVVAIAISPVPYDFMTQAMSDLGILPCVSDTYLIGNPEICSPASALMNSTFIIQGVFIAAGAIILHQYWSDGKKTRIAAWLWVIYGLGYAMSGLYPYDVNFWLHTIPAIPSMFLQIPAMWITARAIRERMPKLSRLTYIFMIISVIALAALVIGLPAGLMQRILYAFVWIWMCIASITLWQRNPIK